MKKKCRPDPYMIRIVKRLLDLDPHEGFSTIITPGHENKE